MLNVLKTLVCAAVIAAPLPALAEKYILMQSTTSTQNSGLFDHLLPKFCHLLQLQPESWSLGLLFVNR